MKTVFQIALTELRLFFYSPIAWILLGIFTFQAGLSFSDALLSQLQTKAMGVENQPYQTFILMTGFRGVLLRILSALYWYIPLMTMGLMSREYSSGSIRLLYSSPVACWQVVWGKYIAMMIYGLALLGIVVVQTVFSACIIKDFEILWVLSGLFGLYLVFCVYVAIGLFMSSLTSYQIIAAVGTLLTLTFLGYVRNIGQDIAFVREITWWLSVSGRGKAFIDGLISSEGVIYFVVVIWLFVSLTILRLQAGKQHYSISKNIVRYGTVICCALWIGYATSRPVLQYYYDVTYVKRNTIAPDCQKFMTQMKGGLNVTMYVNLLDKNYWRGMPGRMMSNLEMFKPYMRFKPEMKLNYVYYYDTPENPRQGAADPELSDRDKLNKFCDEDELDPELFLSPTRIREQVNLKGEGNRLVYLLERENGKKTFLRFYDDNLCVPKESEIAAALKRLVVEPTKVAFLSEHRERSIFRWGDDGYYALIQRNFRYALVNQGFEVDTLSLYGKDEIPQDVDILAIVDPRDSLPAAEQEMIKEYIARGGTLFIAGEPGHQQVMNRIVEPLGIEFLPGRVMQNQLMDFAPDLILGNITKASVEEVRIGRQIVENKGCIACKGVMALDCRTSDGFHVVPLLASPDSAHWNELSAWKGDQETKRPELDSAIGEQEGAWPLMIALSRPIAGKEQRIVVSGDADLFSGGEFNMKRNHVQAMNFGFMVELFHYLSNGEFPVDVSRPEPKDDAIYLNTAAGPWVKGVFVWFVPLGLVGAAVWIRIRRRRK